MAANDKENSDDQTDGLFDKFILKTATECKICQEIVTGPVNLLPCLHWLCCNCASDLFRLVIADNVSPACPFCQERLAVREASELAVVRAESDFAEELVCLTHSLPLTLFCNECCVLACSNCCCDVAHTRVPVAEGRSLMIQKLKAADKLVQKFVSFLQQSYQECLVILQNINSNLTKVTDSIRAAFAAFFHPNVDMVQARLEALLTEAALMSNGQKKTFELQKDEIAVLLDRAQMASYQATTLTTKLELHCSSNTVAACCFVLNRINKEYKDVQHRDSHLKPRNLRFWFPNDTTNLPIESLGYLALSAMDRDWSQISLPVHVIDKSDPSFQGQLNYPHSLGVLPSGKTCLVNNGTQDLQLISQESHKIETICQKVFRSPRHLAVGRDGLIWVGDLDNNLIRCFRESGENICNIEMKGPFGVAVLQSGEICCSNLEGPIIHIFSPKTHQLIRKLTLSSYKGDQRTTLQGMTVLHTGEIVVACRDNEKVNLFSHEGRFIQSIGPVQSPNGVSVTTNNLIIVTEYHGHCISIWTPDGTLIHRWGSKGRLLGHFVHPCSAVQLDDGRVAVADTWNHRIQLF